MSKIIIEANPTFRKEIPDGSYLNISEFFMNTLQAENFMGNPAAFLRLMDCTLNCSWCDSVSVWRYGNPYTIDEVIDLMETSGLVEKLRAGQRLVLTGGSPLLQQASLILLLEGFVSNFGFKPFIEIENECVLIPDPKLVTWVDVWNNSPKLRTSGNKLSKRYKPEIIKSTSELDNSYFKFVITEDGDWDQIEKEFLEPGLIKKSQIVLMPEGETREELHNNRHIAIDMAIKHSIRYSDRLQVVFWNKTVSV
jgi:7-carboxy-7-deazaguanine synthase